MFIYIKPQSLPAPGKDLLRNDHRGPRLAKYDQHPPMPGPLDLLTWVPPTPEPLSRVLSQTCLNLFTWSPLAQSPGLAQSCSLGTSLTCATDYL